MPCWTENLPLRASDMTDASVPKLVTVRQLKAARALAGLTQAGLGAAIGVHERQIRFWERRIPSNPRKRLMIEQALAERGVELTAHPVGVRLAEVG